MKVGSDIIKLELTGAAGHEMEVNKLGEIVLRICPKDILYKPASVEEAEYLKSYAREVILLRVFGSSMSLYLKGTGEEIMDWVQEYEMPRLYTISGITDNNGFTRAFLDGLPYLTLALSDKHNLPILIIKDTKTLRVDHIVLFGGEIGVNQRGQLYNIQGVMGGIGMKSGEHELLKKLKNSEEARAYYKEKGIEHTMRETKKQMRQLVMSRPLILELKVELGGEQKQILVADYKEHEGSVSYREVYSGETVSGEQEISKRCIRGIRIVGLGNKL